MANYQHSYSYVVSGMNFNLPGMWVGSNILNTVGSPISGGITWSGSSTATTLTGTFSFTPPIPAQYISLSFDIPSEELSPTVLELLDGKVVMFRDLYSDSPARCLPLPDATNFVRLMLNRLGQQYFVPKSLDELVYQDDEWYVSIKGAVTSNEILNSFKKTEIL